MLQKPVRVGKHAMQLKCERWVFKLKHPLFFWYYDPHLNQRDRFIDPEEWTNVLKGTRKTRL